MSFSLKTIRSQSGKAEEEELPCLQTRQSAAPPANRATTTTTTSPAAAQIFSPASLSVLSSLKEASLKEKGGSMAGRSSYATPMDFEYENKQHGAVDPTSPFVTNLRQTTQQSSSFASSQGDLGPSWRLQNQIEQAKSNGKRPFSSYESPQKPGAPRLRDPGQGQSVLFSAGGVVTDRNKKLPAKPTLKEGTSAGGNIWNTPRTSRQFIVDSSGGETPDTENWKADSEASPSTPSMGLRNRFARMLGSGGGGGKKSPTKSKEAGEVQKGSPGKGEIVLKPYSQKAASRVLKRREKEVVKRRKLLRKAVDSETETEGGTERQKDNMAMRQEDDYKKGWDIGSFFHYIESHPHLPHVLSFYAQLLLNLFVVFGIMTLGYSFYSTIRSDVDERAREAMSGILAEMAICAKHWQENQCDADFVAPMLRPTCNELKACMERDYKAIGRARVSAKTFAGIFNSFLEEITWKTMIFSVIIISGTFFITNAPFTMWRRQHHEPPHYMPVPPTPHRHVSWEAQQQQFGYTPYGSQYGLPPPQWGSQSQQSLEAAPSQGSPRKASGRESPRKGGRLELEL